MQRMDISKWFFLAGLVFFIFGIFAWMGFPFGKLPGDIHFKNEHSNVYIPIATSVAVSILLTVILNLIFWFYRK